MKKLSHFLNQSDIENQGENPSIKEQKIMLVKAVRYLADNYYNEKTALQLRIIADKICSPKFDPKLKSNVESIIKGIE